MFKPINTLIAVNYIDYVKARSEFLTDDIYLWCYSEAGRLVRYYK